MKPCRCDICGKFRKEADCVTMEGDSSDGYSTGTWVECKDCMSIADLKHYGFITVHYVLNNIRRKAICDGVESNNFSLNYSDVNCKSCIAEYKKLHPEEFTYTLDALKKAIDNTQCPMCDRLIKDH